MKTLIYRGRVPLPPPFEQDRIPQAVYSLWGPISYVAPGAENSRRESNPFFADGSTIYLFYFFVARLLDILPVPS